MKLNKTIAISSILCLSLLNTACQATENQKKITENKPTQEVYTSINDILKNKDFTVDSYKSFINDFLIQANNNFPKDTVKQKEDYIYKDIGTNVPPQVKDNIHQMAIAKLSIQEIIDNTIDINQMPIEEQAKYNKTYHILYINTQNTDLKESNVTKEEILKYFKKEHNAEDHLKKIQNFDIFDGMITKENELSINNSFDMVQKMKINEIKENTYINTSGNETYTLFKLISSSTNNQMIKERMIKVDLFKKQTITESKSDSLINILKYIDKHSNNLNIKETEYNSLREKLNDFDEENLQNMIDYITNLYINDYYKLNHIFNNN